jgi:prepilin-type N-terminal cleavage/methylation domain-containing protein
MIIKKQQGFTLVEIAIVLVIIGLLLGGVLKGQELINSARVRNMADQSSGIQAAYYGFIDRYRQVPGDMLPDTACTTVGAAVDPNCGGAGTVVGGVAGSNGQNGRIDMWEEAGAVWPHLAVAGFLSGTYTGITADSATYETGTLGSPPVVPSNAFAAPVLLGYTDDYDAQDAGAGNVAIVRLAYSLGAAPASILRELDVKLDDSIPGTGVVRATVSTANTNEVAGTDDFGGGAVLISDESGASGTDCVNGGSDSVGGTWNVDSNNSSCNALFLY